MAVYVLLILWSSFDWQLSLAVRGSLWMRALIIKMASLGFFTWCGLCSKKVGLDAARSLKV